MDKRFKTFVGKNIDYYEEAWNKKSKWNWAAFFFPFYWLVYRKMFKTIFSILGGMFILGLFLFYTNEPLDGLFYLITIIIMFTMGFNGNTFYKRKAEKTIIHISNLKLGEEEELRELSHRGGTSIFGVILVWLLLLLIIVISKN